MTTFGIRRTHFWGLTAAVALVSMIAYKPLVIDRLEASGGPTPPSDLMPFFMVHSLLSAVAFGFGIAVLVFGGRVVAALPERARTWGNVARIGLFWITAPWLVHESLHALNGHENWGGLLALEFAFHVTTYAAGALVAIAALQVVRLLPLDAALAGATAPTQGEAEPVASATVAD